LLALQSSIAAGVQTARGSTSATLPLARLPSLGPVQNYCGTQRVMLPELRAAWSWMRQGGGPIEPGNDEGRLHLIPEGERQED